MSKSGFIIFSIAFVLAITFQQGTALKCYRCTSDSSASYCDDPFDPTVINESQRRWTYVDCRIPPQSNFNDRFNTLSQQKAVCKKVKQHVNDKIVVSRSCAFVDINATPEDCITDSTLPYIRTEFCETCSTDGCNSAGQYRPYIFLVAVSAILTKLFAL